MFLKRLFSKGSGCGKHFPIEREKCCAFTGHRPEKLYGKEAYVIAELRKEIVNAVADGYTTFVTGCSRGVDLWAADIVVELQRSNKDIRLVCAIPFPGFDERWPVDWKKHLQLVKKKADHIQTVEQSYSPGAYHKRTNSCAKMLPALLLYVTESQVEQKIRSTMLIAKASLCD